MATTDEIRRRWLGAKGYAKRRGYPSHSDDFAQEFIAAWLENPKKIYETYWIDYIRKVYGDTRHENGRLKANSLLSPWVNDTEQPTGAPDVEESMVRTEELGGALEKLTRDDQIILKLYYYFDLSLKEIGELFNVTESRVSQRIRNAVKKVREDTKLDPILESQKFSADRTLEDVENTHILMMLRYCNDNQVETAKRLGISERGMRYKVFKLRQKGLY